MMWVWLKGKPMKRASIYSLKVRFVYAVKHVEVEKMFTARKTIERVPIGEVHLFEITKVENVFQTSGWSFCGKSHSEIGSVFDESDKRPESLPLCAECQTAWKNHPLSPWRAYVNGDKAK